jgi:hypothetical protein
MTEKYKPCRYLEFDSGKKSITLSDFEELSEPIEEADGQGGGHSLESVVRAVMEIREIKLPEVLFDCEGGMFCAVSKNADQLAKVAAIIRELIESPDLLSQAIDTATDGDYFE